MENHSKSEEEVVCDSESIQPGSSIADEKALFRAAIRENKVCVFKDFFEPRVLDGQKLLEWIAEAIACRSATVLSWLLNKKANVKSCRKYFKQGSASLMVKAVQAGDVNIVELLIKAGTQRLNLNQKGDSDLHLSIHYRNINLIKYLCQFRKTVNVKNKVGCSALFLAVSMNYPDAVKLLIAAGADPSRHLGHVEPLKAYVDPEFAECLENGDTLLHAMIRALPAFKKRGDDTFNLFCDNILTILSGKIRTSAKSIRGHKTVFDELVLSKVEVRSIYKKLIDLTVPITMNVPFQHVICLKDPELCLTVLPLIDADVNDIGVTPFTPLMVACAHLNVAAVKWLLENGAKANSFVECEITYQDFVLLGHSNLWYTSRGQNTHFTPMHFAVSTIGSVEEFESLVKVLTLLIKHGADVNARDFLQATPLVSAVRNLQAFSHVLTVASSSQAASVVRLLLQAGADPEILFKKYSAQAQANTMLLETITSPNLKHIVFMLLEISMSLVKTARNRNTGKNAQPQTPVELVKHFSNLAIIVPECVIQQSIAQPRSLLEMCRRTIRDTYRDKLFFNTIHTLPVLLQDFIRLKYTSWSC